MNNQGARSGSGPLRVLIAATPKTGIIWLKHLLATAYSLPMVDIDEVTDGRLNTPGNRWVAHQHFAPTTEMIDCLRRNHVVVLTMFRHPAEVLVALRPLAENRTGRAIGNADGWLEHVHGAFASQLNLSLLWHRLGATVIRHEELQHDPVKAMKCLAPQLGAASDNHLRSAVAVTNIACRRERLSPRLPQIEAGGGARWWHLLPADVVETLRELAPFPAQFAALGYSLDPAPTDSESPAESAAFDPFGGAVAFDNGVPISDFLVSLFFLTCPDPVARWPRPTCTSDADSFYAWLNAPCAADPCRDGPGILITNLACAIYQARTDLQKAFPDVFGSHRLAFVNWFLLYAKDEYRLDLPFLAPVFESIAKANTFAPRPKTDA